MGCATGTPAPGTWLIWKPPSPPIQQAVQATHPDSPDRPALLNNLGVGLRDRYAAQRGPGRSGSGHHGVGEELVLPHTRFAALPVTYQLGQQRQGARVAADLVTAYLEQAQQLHPRSPSVPRQALEIAEGSKSRLLTQLVGRGPLPLPSGLSQEIAAREQQLLAELTALDIQELAIHDHFAPTQEETSSLQRLQQRQANLSNWRSCGPILPALVQREQRMWPCVAVLPPHGKSSLI